MKARFSGKRIREIVTVVPDQVIDFDDELEKYNADPSKNARLKKVMGFGKRRIVTPEVCASDLCEYGLKHIFKQGSLRPEHIDILLFVSQSPDQIIPPTSNLLQGRLGLKTSTLCMDINQGCAGYLVGLLTAFSLLETTDAKTVALLNADTLSQRANPMDRNIYPMVGDAGSVTIISNDDSESSIPFHLYMDGANASALQIPAGGFRIPCSEETRKAKTLADGNMRSQEDFIMDGAEVFNFVQDKVPPLIEEILSENGRKTDDIDYFLFHQPNRFLLRKLAEGMGVSLEKLPCNVVEQFGNASSVTIPTNICLNLADRVTREKLSVCLSGFGSGLTWAAALMELGPLDRCELIEFPCSTA